MNIFVRRCSFILIFLHFFMNTLQDFLHQESSERCYFKSDVPFYNGGGDFMLYRVATPEDLEDKGIVQESSSIGKNYFFVIPARYDVSKRVIFDLIPVEFFRNQHLNDPLFQPQDAREEHFLASS